MTIALRLAFAVLWAFIRLTYFAAVAIVTVASMLAGLVMLLVGGLILLIMAAEDATGSGERTRVCAGPAWSAQSAAARG